MCKILICSKSGYYEWVKRQEREDEDDIIANHIYECQIEADYTYGYRRIKEWLLSRKKLIVNHKTVLRIMVKYGLLSQIRRKRKYIHHMDKACIANNILARDFNTNNKSAKWVTDISYIHTYSGVYYLSIIKDLYDGFIISYSLGKQMDMGLVADTLKKAKKEVANGLVLHSDQGSQYTSHAYKELLKEYGITASMSRPGTPLDNAPVESFFGALKCECIYRHKPKDFDHAAQLIDDYIHFYNYVRIQSKSKITPYEKRTLRLAV